MPINNGVIEMSSTDSQNRTVLVRIYYDSTQPAGPDQPLINGPRGYCLDVTNASGRAVNVTLSGLTGNPFTVTVGTGDPVTTGQGRSRTAAEVATLGFTTRGSLGNMQLG
jgi:hypothetical protein